MAGETDLNATIAALDMQRAVVAAFNAQSGNDSTSSYYRQLLVNGVVDQDTKAVTKQYLRTHARIHPRRLAQAMMHQTCQDRFHPKRAFSRKRRGATPAEEKRRVVAYMLERAYNKGATRHISNWQRTKVNGKWCRMRKYYMQYTLKTTWESYRKAYPESQLRYQTFCSLRPAFLKMYRTRSVDTCACWLCENVSNAHSALKAFFKDKDCKPGPVGDRAAEGAPAFHHGPRAGPEGHNCIGVNEWFAATLAEGNGAGLADEDLFRRPRAAAQQAPQQPLPPERPLPQSSPQQPGRRRLHHHAQRQRRCPLSRHNSLPISHRRHRHCRPASQQARFQSQAQMARSLTATTSPCLEMTQ